MCLVLTECTDADGGPQRERGSDRTEETPGESERRQGRRMASAGQERA